MSREKQDLDCSLNKPTFVVEGLAHETHFNAQQCCYETIKRTLFINT